MTDAYSRTWVDFVDDIDAEELNDLEARMESRSEGLFCDRNVKTFGAVGDGEAYDLQAFLDAIDALQTGITIPHAGGTLEGGAILVPDGVYRLESVLPIAKSGVHLHGTGTFGAVLLIDHADGPGVDILSDWGNLKNIRVIASTDRQAATGDDLVGIRVSPEDVAFSSPSDPVPPRQWRFDGITSTSHPSHGILDMSHGPLRTYKTVQVSSNGGHGFCVSNGIGEGYRTNKLAQAAGFVDIVGMTTNNNQGHGLAVGNPLDDGLTLDDESLPNPCLRVTVKQLDCGANLLDSGLSLGDAVDDVWIRGQDCTIEDSAVNGRVSLWGVNLSYRSLRHPGGAAGSFTDGDGVISVVHVRTSATYVTRGVHVQDMHPSGASCDPGVLIDDDVVSDAVQVYQAGHTNMTTVATTGLASVVAAPRGLQVPGGLLSDAIIIGDDKVAYIEFQGAVSGQISISPQKTGVPLIAHFRVGDSDAFTQRLSTVSANVATATTVALASAPTGTTGTDTNLTITAINDSPRLYIENRTGASRTLRYTLLNITTNTAPIGPPVVLP